MLLMEEPAPRGGKHLFQASLAGQITALVLAARSRNQGLGAGRFAISWSLERLIGIGLVRGKDRFVIVPWATIMPSRSVASSATAHATKSPRSHPPDRRPVQRHAAVIALRESWHDALDRRAGIR